jgi:hypothetical protein
MKIVSCKITSEAAKKLIGLTLIASMAYSTVDWKADSQCERSDKLNDRRERTLVKTTL